MCDFLEDLNMACLDAKRESSIVLMAKVLEAFESNGFRPSDIIYGLMVNISQKSGYWHTVAAALEKAQIEAFERSEPLDRMESINGLE